MITTQLLITLSLHGLSGLILVAAGTFVLIQNPRRPINLAIFFNFLAVAAYEAGMVLGPLMPTYELAYWVWFTNLVDVFITITTTLVLIIVIDQLKEYRWYLIGVVAVGFAIIVAALISPHWFLPQVEPKLYFPWYLDGGWLYAVMVAFFMIAPLIPYIGMVRAYIAGYDRIRVEYFLLMYAIGYSIGPLNFALVFDIPIDPLYGSVIGLGFVPLAYGVVAKNLLDIRVVVARAALYSGGIAALAAFLALLISLNNVIVAAYPWLQAWVVPIFTATVAFIAGRLFWLNRLENDRVKYEFITVATHKLRTPLTQISWGVRTLLERTNDTESREIIEHIQHSSNRLIELTNILFETTEEQSQDYAYSKETVGLLAVTREALERLAPTVEKKRLTVNLHSDQEVNVSADRRRIASVIEVMLENAVAYTPEGGLVQIIAYVKRGRAYYSVRDQGIGVSADDQKRIFFRFYRTDAAKRLDTEGVGLGLAMAKNIVEKHHGKMGVESLGEGKGSTFWFWVPAR